MTELEKAVLDEACRIYLEDSLRPLPTSLHRKIDALLKKRDEELHQPEPPGER